MEKLLLAIIAAGVLGGTITLTNAKADCDCGKSQMKSRNQERIVGGTKAEEGDFPWRVSIKLKKSEHGLAMCGGAIIHPQWILTAGHCVEKDGVNIDADKATVYAGSLKRWRGKKYEVESIYSNFSRGDDKKDIALLKLSKSIKYSKNISPLCLPYQYKGQTEVEVQGWASGWGNTEKDGSLSKVLMKAEMEVIKNSADNCGAEDYQACSLGNGTTTCGGDSGTSFDVKGDDGKYYAFGLTSKGTCEPDDNNPTTLTRVSECLDIIEYNTGEEFCQE